MVNDRKKVLFPGLGSGGKTFDKGDKKKKSNEIIAIE